MSNWGLNMCIRTIEIFVFACSFGAGIIGAIYWFRSAKVKAVDTIGQLYTGRPVDPEKAAVGILDALDKAARLNMWAAIWTAISILLSAISTAINFLSN